MHMETPTYDLHKDLKSRALHSLGSLYKKRPTDFEAVLEYLSQWAIITVHSILEVTMFLFSHLNIKPFLKYKIQNSIV